MEGVGRVCSCDRLYGSLGLPPRAAASGGSPRMLHTEGNTGLADGAYIRDSWDRNRTLRLQPALPWIEFRFRVRPVHAQLCRLSSSINESSLRRLIRQ